LRQILHALALLLSFHVVAQDSVKLSGNIQNRLSDTVLVSYNNNKLAYYPNKYIAVLDKKGNFSLKFPVPDGVYTQAELQHGSKLADLMLYPGDSLVMTVNAKSFDTSISYKGTGSMAQNFIAQHTLVRGRMNQYSQKIRGLVEKEPAEFLKGMEAERKIEIAYLDAHKNGLLRLFVKYWAGFYDYFNYFFTEQYPQMHEIGKKKRYTDTIPEANYAVIKSLPYAFDDTMLQVPPYLLYLTGIFEVKLKAAGYTYTGDDSIAFRNVLDSTYKLAYKLLPGKSAEYFIAQSLYGRAKYQPIARTKEHYNKFKQRWPSSEYMPLLESQIDLAQRLSPGMPAPDFDIVTLDGKSMKLSDLKGKVVYLHFWASWCRQCVGEMISEKKAKELLKRKPVEFVYVSLDRDTTLAQMLIKKYHIEGTFTYLKDEWASKEIQLYGVQNLPAYYLIDKDGNFAVQNPPTPMQSTELLLAIGKIY
jgi:peroxiredoxin